LDPIFFLTGWTGRSASGTGGALSLHSLIRHSHYSLGYSIRLDLVRIIRLADRELRPYLAATRRE
jgi:hypothetical protein